MSNGHLKMADRPRERWRLQVPSRAYAVVAFTVSILVAVLCRRFVLDGSDPFKCKALISSGVWYDDHTWLTPGCVSQSYGRQSIHECAQRRKVVFVGDASVQGTFWAFLSKLELNVERQSSLENDIRYADDEMEIEYLWDPYLNGSNLFRHLQAYREGESDAALLMVVGGGAWYAENGAVNAYVKAVQRIADSAAPASGIISAGSRTYSRADGPGNVLLFAPMQEPFVDTAGSGTQQSVYSVANEALLHHADSYGLDVLWSFAEMTAGRKDKYAYDLVQASDEVERQRIDVLMGARCNANAASRVRFPNTKTCCATWRGPNWVQTGSIILALAILPSVVFFDYIWPVLKADDRVTVRALCAFMSAVSLQHMTDRTHIFEQVQRLPLQLPNLRNMIIVIFIIGAASIQRSKPPKRPSGSDKEPDQPFLPRDQTDEWKGWMQALIITYHYNMAWGANWFWEIIRLAVSSYLFLTGFGHTVFFLQKRDFSFRRFAAVMIRTNMLPIALAYVMRTRWVLYYYMPLSTFWFTVVYATLAIAPTWNENTPLLVSKIGISAAIVQAFLRTNDLPETIARFFALTCKISFNADHFFQLRVKSDAYITYVGMLVAIFYIWAKDVLTSDRRQDRGSRLFRKVFPFLKNLTIAVSLAGMIAFWYLVNQRVHEQKEWVAIQPYITFVPILTFTVLRNARPMLRNYHSAAFAWLGRYSGEMYVMQDHLWLAGDQEAVLRTGFFHGDETLTHDRWRDLLLITPLYLIACCVIGDSTTTIAVWFTKEPAKIKEVARKQLREEVEMGLLAGADGVENGDHDEKMELELPPSRWSRLRGAMWPDSLRNRALLVLFIMWFLNMTYT